MAKVTRRGAKKSRPRTSRTVRESKSTETAVNMDEQLRLNLFTCLHHSDRMVKETLEDVDTVFKYIKYGAIGYIELVKRQPASLHPKVQLEKAHLQKSGYPEQPSKGDVTSLPDPPHATTSHDEALPTSRKHFDSEQITM